MKSPGHKKKPQAFYDAYRCALRPELVWGLLWPMGVMDLPARHIDGSEK